MGCFRVKSFRVELVEVQGFGGVGSWEPETLNPYPEGSK